MEPMLWLLVLRRDDGTLIIDQITAIRSKKGNTVIVRYRVPTVAAEDSDKNRWRFSLGQEPEDIACDAMRRTRFLSTSRLYLKGLLAGSQKTEINNDSATQNPPIQAGHMHHQALAKN